MVEQQILRAVKELIRNGYHNRHGGVYPWMVLARLDLSISERTVRRRMREMTEVGLLIRVGKNTGYRLPSVRMVSADGIH